MVENRKKKKIVYIKLDDLDRKMELYPLSAQELENKHCLSAELTVLLRKAELY